MKLEKKPTYIDTDKMPFGKYKNELLQDVPASYLHWLYHEINCGNNISLVHYVENNINALKQETPNLIWKTPKT